MLDTPIPDRVLLAEVRDGLHRKQRELPPRLLAHVDAGLLARIYLKPAVGQVAAEREMVEGALETLGLLEGRPRPALLVEHGPRCTSTGDALLDRLAAPGGGPAVTLVDRDVRLVADRVGRLTRRGTVPTCIAAEPTLALPLPRTGPRPRLHLIPGNFLGTLGTLGAIRALRVLRATMEPSDRLLLGVDVRRDGGVVEEAFASCGALAAVALGMLDATNRALGTDFPLDAFAHSARWEGEFSRVETTLVAVRAVRARMPGGGTISMRKGQSIRTGVHATFDRRRLTAMLDSVGFAVEDWAATDRVALVAARTTRGGADAAVH